MEAIPWSTLGPGGLISLIVVLIIRGDLIPRKQFDAMVADRDFWRDLAQRRSTALEEVTTEVARASGKALEAIPKAALKNSHHSSEECAP